MCMHPFLHTSARRTLPGALSLRPAVTHILVPQQLSFLNVRGLCSNIQTRTSQHNAPRAASQFRTVTRLGLSGQPGTRTIGTQSQMNQMPMHTAGSVASFSSFATFATLARKTAATRLTTSYTKVGPVTPRGNTRFALFQGVSQRSAHTSSGGPKKPADTPLFGTGTKIALALTTTTTAGYLYYKGRTYTTDSEMKQVKSQLPRVTDEEMDEFLHRNEVSFPVQHYSSPVKHGLLSSIFGSKSKADSEQTPVIAVHNNQVNSNSPIEDYHSEFSTDNGLIFCVFDGHSGTECANLLSKYMGSYVADEIAQIDQRDTKNSPEDTPRKKKVMEAMRRAFVRLDNDIVNGGFAVEGPHLLKKLHDSLRPALAGACAIVTYIEGNSVYVAWSGDSRAVLGRQRSDSSFETVALSVDHTAANTEEYARLLREHPGELYSVVSRGRILGGLMPSRAFGDSRYKWSLENQESLKTPLGIRTMANRNYLTPPYVTAEPEVTYYELDPSRDKFLIMATDGIYDMLSSEQCVELTASYMTHQGHLDKAINLESLEGKDLRWEYKDGNASTSLIRNALGRGRPDMTPHLLAIPSSQARRFRDDMTATIIFFGNAGDNIPVPGTSKDEPNATIVRADRKMAAPKNHQLQTLVDEAKKSYPTPKL